MNISKLNFLTSYWTVETFILLGRLWFLPSFDASSTKSCL